MNKIPTQAFLQAAVEAAKVSAEALEAAHKQSQKAQHQAQQDLQCFMAAESLFRGEGMEEAYPISWSQEGETLIMTASCGLQTPVSACWSWGSPSHDPKEGSAKCIEALKASLKMRGASKLRIRMPPNGRIISEERNAHLVAHYMKRGYRVNIPNLLEWEFYTPDPAPSP